MSQARVGPSRGLRRLRMIQWRAWTSGLLLLGGGCAQLAVPVPSPPSPTLAALSEPKRKQESPPTAVAALPPKYEKTEIIKPIAKPSVTETEVVKPSLQVAQTVAVPSVPNSARPASKQLPATVWKAAGTSGSPYATFTTPKAEAKNQDIVQASATETPAGQDTDPPAQESAKPPAPTLPAQEPKASEPLGMPTPTTRPESLPAEAAPLPVPLSLDIVFRLAEEQNAQVSLARERVSEAFAENCIAKKKWLPDIYVGTAWYRHEGGIQLQQGPNINSSTGADFNGLEIDSRLDIKDLAYQQLNAQRRVWQQKGELRKVTTEALVDAATTYIDLLAARSAEAIVREENTKLAELVNQAKTAAAEPLFRADVARLEAELEGQLQLLAKLKAQASAASAKLAYLLQLDPACEIVPVDKQLVPFDLIDTNIPPGELVAHALQGGPGVQEMEGLLATIHDGMAKSKGLMELLPIFEVRMAEGVFGAGPGQSSVWNNRWDLGMQARWNLSPYLTRNERMKAAQAKVNQAHIVYQDLRGKLAAGILEAQETSTGTKDQISRGETQIAKATEAYSKSNQRRIDLPRQYPFTDVLLSISSLTRARLGYLAAVSEHDKAQVRLMVLLGDGACRAFGPGPK